MKKRKPPVEPSTAAKPEVSTDTSLQRVGSQHGGLSKFLLVLMVVISAWGVWQRVDRCDRFPSMFHTMRQYTSTLRARDLYLGMKPVAELSDAEEAYASSVSKEVVYEPPLNELIVAAIYRLIGQEQPSVSSYVATFYWCVGAFALYQIVGLLGGGAIAQFASVGFFMTSPLGVIVCRTFQPEPLMIATFLVALWLVLRFGYLSSWSHAALLGIVCGLLLLAKPGFMLFPLCAAMTGLGVADRGWLGVFKDPRWYLFGVLCAIPSVFWIEVICKHQQSTSFMPNLLLNVGLWRRWLGFLETYYGLGVLAFAALGIAMAADSKRKWVYMGLPIGYLLFVVATNYRSTTHSYYCVVLLPILSICLAPLVDRLFREPNQATRSIAGLVLLAVWCTLLGFQARLETQTHYAPLTEDEYAAIGKTVGIGGKAVAITDDYSRALKFHSYIDARNWPSAADRALSAAAGEEVQTLEGQLNSFRSWGATHFVVVLTGRAMAEQSTLVELSNRYSIAAGVPGKYIVFDLSKPAASSTPGQPDGSKAG